MIVGRHLQDSLKIIPLISTWPNKYATLFMRSKSETKRGKDRCRCNSSKKCNKRPSNKSKQIRDTNSKRNLKLQLRKRKQVLQPLSRRRIENNLRLWELLPAILRTTVSTKR
jgi:hypothetical protein